MIRGQTKGWHPVDFLEFWTDEKVDQQPPDLHKAEYLAKRFTADAALQGFTLATSNFDKINLVKYMLHAMAAPRV